MAHSGLKVIAERKARQAERRVNVRDSSVGVSEDEGSAGAGEVGLLVVGDGEGHRVSVCRAVKEHG